MYMLLGERPELKSVSLYLFVEEMSLAQRAKSFFIF